MRLQVKVSVEDRRETYDIAIFSHLVVVATAIRRSELWVETEVRTIRLSSQSFAPREISCTMWLYVASKVSHSSFLGFYLFPQYLSEQEREFFFVLLTYVIWKWWQLAPMSSRFAGEMSSPTENAERLYSPPSLTFANSGSWILFLGLKKIKCCRCVYLCFRKAKHFANSGSWIWFLGLTILQGVPKKVVSALFHLFFT